MESLPNEIIVNEILPYLYLRDLLRLKCCSKLFSKLDQQSNILYCRNIKEDNNSDIWQWIYPLLWPLNNYVVAGGQALRTLNRESWHGDLDIFFYNQSIEQFITQCYNLFKDICKHSDLTWSWQLRPVPGPIFNYYTDIDLKKESQKDVYLIRLSGVPPKNGLDGYPFQRLIDLVYTKYTNTKDILNNFDLPFCGVGFIIDKCNFNFMMSSIECYTAAKDKKCNIVLTQEDKDFITSMSYLQLNPQICSKERNLKMDHMNLLLKRIEKYKERGYKTIIHSNSEGKKVRTIREKWESRQQHLMKYTL